MFIDCINCHSLLLSLNLLICCCFFIIIIILIIFLIIDFTSLIMIYIEKHYHHYRRRYIHHHCYYFWLASRLKRQCNKFHYEINVYSILLYKKMKCYCLRLWSWNVDTQTGELLLEPLRDN